MRYDIEREQLTSKMVENLPALRALLNMTQETLSELIGIGRQSYIMIETGKTKLRWDTFVTLSVLFSNNDSTSRFIEMLGLNIQEIKKMLTINETMSVGEKNYSNAQKKLNEYDTSMAAIYFEAAGERFLKENRLFDAIEAYEKAIYCFEIDGESEKAKEIQDAIKRLK